MQQVLFRDIRTPLISSMFYVGTVWQILLSKDGTERRPLLKAQELCLDHKFTYIQGPSSTMMHMYINKHK